MALVVMLVGLAVVLSLVLRLLAPPTAVATLVRRQVESGAKGRFHIRATYRVQGHGSMEHDVVYGPFQTGDYERVRLALASVPARTHVRVAVPAMATTAR